MANELQYFVAQNERETIKRRQAEGIASAKARGVKLGRPVKKPPADFCEIIKLAEAGEITQAEAMRQTGLKQTAFYSRLREYRAGRREW